MTASTYNGKKPHILVNSFKEKSMTRGDVHGYVGLARRLAERLGTDYTVVTADMLQERYPLENKGLDQYDRYIDDNGLPDFIFHQSYFPNGMWGRISGEGRGVLLGGFNECARKYLQREDTQLSIELAGIPAEVVPHNLTAADLAHEGRKFAEEYADLPRPFIGVAIGSMNDKDSNVEFAKKLACLKKSYPEATFFLCTCHRTDEKKFRIFTNHLETLFSADTPGNFPIIEFDFRSQAALHGLENTWNPYKGLLDQADHMIIAGSSGSMMSEALATGKSCYVWNFFTMSDEMTDLGWVKNLAAHPDGKPLVTNAIGRVDIGEACVSALIRLHGKHMAKPPVFDPDFSYLELN